ncbi:MAG: hypothetical protein IT578_07415 [Verrucomicrobiae bacterium]|nr:hypothetical protein [Verrucomicrobiae bacterium]
MISLRRLLLSVGIAWTSAMVAVAQTKPVALVGASYGRYERKAIANNVLLASKEREILFEDRGDEFPVDDLERYSLVIVATAVTTPLDAAGFAKLETWVRGGGHLLLIRQAPNAMMGAAASSKTPPFEWAGFRRAQSFQSPEEVEVLEGGHRILKGVFDEADLRSEKKPQWMAAPNVLAVPFADMENLIGNPRGCLVGMTPVGKGWVAFLGSEFFRLRAAKSDADGSWCRLLRNLVDDAGPATSSDTRAGQMAAACQSARKLLVWTREWTRGERYSPRFDPPLPDEKELVAALAADLAVDEVESLQVNLTPIVPLGDAAWRLDPGAFPADHLEFLVQDAPAPIPWPKRPELAREFPYWLMPPKYVKGADAFPMPPPGETRVVWLRIATASVKPGAYTVTLHLKFAAGEKLALPVKLTVHPVRLTDKRIIALAAAGQVYGDVNRAAPALRFARDLQAHGVEWSLMNALRPSTLGAVGETESLDKVLIARKERIKAGDFPRVDFAALDPWMEQAIGHNLTRFKNHDMTENLGLKALGLNEAQQRAARVWFRREVARYLRDKGVRVMVAFSGDELNEAELRTRFLPWAKEMADAGWGVCSSFSFGEAKPALIREMSPLVALWTLNRGLMPSFVMGLREGKYAMRPGAILGTYGAGEGRGSEHRKPLSRGRGLGWESWMWGVRDCAVNPYFKSWLYYADYGDSGETGGVAGERFVSYLDQDDLSAPMADCPFWEGVRDGLEEGNLAAILDRLLDGMARAGGAAAAKAAAVRADLARVMGDSPEALVRWETTVSHGQNKFRKILADNESFRKGKQRVLELLDTIRSEARATIRPSLRWNDAPLVESGTVCATIFTGEVGAEPIVATARDLVGIEIPVSQGAATLPSSRGTFVVVGNAAQNPLIRAVLDRFKSGDAGTDGSGNWHLREFEDKAAGQRFVVVSGTEAEATRKAVGFFCRFLRSKDAWLLPTP